MIHIEIPGKPIPLRRARISGKRMFDAQSYERKVTRLQMGVKHDPLPFEGNVDLILVFYFSPAKSLSKKKRAGMMGTYHNQRPDLDNLAKWVLDCGNGLLWNDDCQVVQIDMCKVWDERERTSIVIQEAEKYIP